jgi:hypothetical protein
VLTSVETMIILVGNRNSTSGVASQTEIFRPSVPSPVVPPSEVDPPADTPTMLVARIGVAPLAVEHRTMRCVAVAVASYMTTCPG